MFGNFLIQTYASVVRIEKYLEEDEVPEWVSWQSESRLGRSSPNSGSSEGFDERVGFENASFAWVSPNKHTEEDKKNKDKKSKKDAKPKPPLMARIKGIFKKASKPADAEAAAETAEEDEEDKPFELRDIDITFKLGAINLVSGPTGSGKSSRTFPFDTILPCFDGARADAFI